MKDHLAHLQNVMNNPGVVKYLAEQALHREEVAPRHYTSKILKIILLGDSAVGKSK